MKLKLFGLVSLVVVAVPGPVLAKSSFTPWGIMNELGPWDSEDVLKQRYARSQPHYPTRPIRKPRLRQLFSRPINHASVDIDARLLKAPVYVKKIDAVGHYDIQIKVLTPEYNAMTIIAYHAGATPSPDNRQLELNCEIESIRRWDRDRMHGWGARVAGTFNDRGTVKQLEKAKTVLMAHGVCHPLIEKRGQLATQGVYEYHAAFVSQFEDKDKAGLENKDKAELKGKDKAELEDKDKAGVMMEIGTGMRFNTVGNGYFQRPSVGMAFTAIRDRDEIRIKYR